VKTFSVQRGIPHQANYVQDWRWTNTVGFTDRFSLPLPREMPRRYIWVWAGSWWQPESSAHADTEWGTQASLKFTLGGVQSGELPLRWGTTPNLLGAISPNFGLSWSCPTLTKDFGRGGGRQPNLFVCFGWYSTSMRSVDVPCWELMISADQVELELQYVNLESGAVADGIVYGMTVMSQTESF
jgi:hypothetical protein